MDRSDWIEGFLGLFFPNVCQICQQHGATRPEGYVCEHCWSAPGAIQFIRPPYCVRCGLPFAGELTTEFECANCTDIRLYFSSARSAVTTQGLVKDIIHRFKCQRQVWFETFLADLLARELSVWLRPNDSWDCLIPVPLHASKERERGFNQTARIASSVAKRTGLPVVTHALTLAPEGQVQTC